MRYITFIITIFLLVSCKNEAPIDNVFIHNEDNLGTIEPEHIEHRDLEIYTENFINRQEAIKTELESLTPEKANALYERYFTENSTEIDKISALEATFINNYASMDNSPPDSIKYKENLLSKASLEVWDIGEGMSELRTMPDFYLNIFKNYVTEDYKIYITLLAEDDKVLFDNDAALNIPIEDVGKRILNWENYIIKYPESKKASDAKEIYRYYQSAFLLGEDNTPS